jgi:hypothetical protein
MVSQDQEGENVVAWLHREHFGCALAAQEARLRRPAMTAKLTATGGDSVRQSVTQGYINCAPQIMPPFQKASKRD